MCAKSANVKEQCLWALSNMSADETACLSFIAMPNILSQLLSHIGIAAVPLNVMDAEGNYGPPYLTGAHLTDFREYPSLSVMRHITVIIGNFVRQDSHFSSLKILQLEYKLHRS